MQPFCTCVPSPETTELTKKSEMSEIQGALEKEKERNEQVSSKLSLVPGTTDWFNVKYDGEDTILSKIFWTSITSVMYNRVMLLLL